MKTMIKGILALTIAAIYIGVVLGVIVGMLSGCLVSVFSETPPAQSIETALTVGNDALATFAGFHHAPPDASIEDGVNMITNDFGERI